LTNAAVVVVVVLSADVIVMCDVDVYLQIVS